MVYPPLTGVPKPLRGKNVTVTFYVNVIGRVDRVEIVPDVPSGRYRTDLLDAMMNWRFRPARDSTGIPVAGVHTAVLSLPNN
jgi:hypothetical protein